MRYPSIGLILATLALSSGPARGQMADDIDRPPIRYSESTPDNRVARLQERLATGEAALAYDEKLGYLAALLEALEVPLESQMLVFSKTSLQRDRISPRTPRAIYFSDDVYIGYCRAGDVLEVSAVDPRLGAVFYTLDQKDRERARLLRQTDNCLVCHSSSRTAGVPGHVVRSLFADASGQPILSAGSHAVDHTTPLDRRWGGWYVTGTHGAQTHLGNLVTPGDRVIEPVDNARGQNVVSLQDRLAVEKYLTPHSDIVALMVLEHQTLVHNLLTKANYATRQALAYEADMNRSLGEPKGTRLESTTHRIASAGDDLVDAMLLVGEAKLTAPIEGTSGYAARFACLGPRDGEGRSLRDLDLTTRLFKHPCSYLIYSESFDALPDEMRAYVWKRLWDVLAGPSTDKRYAHLAATDRRAIIEILRSTKSGLPDYWLATSR